ncbi:hypothetical protein TTRE_0000390001 [Trichuris trichiura]|uniref:Uncharacterized protein n=1 Tax=Trichuris trichiura TaxID=36087 RepID=A0A077Z5A3_TRITR|nr:hypothetical protein TTRE_0000390001 [Trichuris trichiura]
MSRESGQVADGTIARRIDWFRTGSVVPSIGQPPVGAADDDDGRSSFQLGALAFCLGKEEGKLLLPTEKGSLVLPELRCTSSSDCDCVSLYQRQQRLGKISIDEMTREFLKPIIMLARSDEQQTVSSQPSLLVVQLSNGVTKDTSGRQWRRDARHGKVRQVTKKAKLNHANVPLSTRNSKAGDLVQLPRQRRPPPPARGYNDRSFRALLIAAGEITMAISLSMASFACPFVALYWVVQPADLSARNRYPRGSLIGNSWPSDRSRALRARLPGVKAIAQTGRSNGSKPQRRPAKFQAD